MRQVINGALGLLLILIASCAAAPQSKVEDIPKLLPKNCVSAEHYRCKDMVDCVNSFRRIGKDESLSLMTEYIQARRKAGDDYKEELKLLFVCRLLFVNTDGWKPLMLGHPVPEVNPDVANEFPLFPIALSDGLPFNLVNGYAGIGVPSETGYGCVKQCKEYSIRTNDMPSGKYGVAAKKLIQSELFQKLYKNKEDAEAMAIEIMNQAQ